VLEHAVAYLKNHDCDSVIAVGGASSIDTAKSVAAMATNPGNIKDLGVDLDYMPQMVSDSMRSGNVLVNPRLTTAAEIERIISNAWHGVH